MKVRELQAGSEMPSGEEDRSTERTSKPDVTGHQKNKKKNTVLFILEMSPSSPTASRQTVDSCTNKHHTGGKRLKGS